MGFEQDTLIYIEDQEKLDASAAANSFAHKDVRNRAYINTLGAELAMKYLASEGLSVQSIYNIHSIKKILEELDIADVMLPNIHIDVRVVFDENVIFIPKSHFEYNLVPDIYLVFNLAKDLSHVKFLGFFEPKLINKNNANNEYYFIEKEKLTAPHNLKEYIENFKGNTKETLSENEISDSERIIIAMADNDVSEDEKKYLIKQLTKSAELRDKFIEYENFETLSYKAMTDPQIHKKEPAPQAENASVETLQEPEIQNTDEQGSSDVTDTAGFLDTLSDTAASAAGLAAVETADNLLDNLNETSDIVDTTLDIVSNDIELPADLTSNDFTAPEPLALESIDTSEIDNIQIPEEKVEQETISLDNIDIPVPAENTDFIDSIDNKISFDDIPGQTQQTEPEPTAAVDDEPVISFDDIEISHLDETATEEPQVDNIVSFDDIDTTNIEPPQDLNIDTAAETLSFTNIPEEPVLNNSINNMETQNIELEDINITGLDDEEETPDSFSDTTADSEFGEELLNTDDSINEIPELNVEAAEPDMQISDDIMPVEDNTSSFEESSAAENNITDNNALDDFLDDSPLSLDDTEQPVDDASTEKNAGFGNNLLENLSADNIDDISIENLGLDDNNFSTDTADISSDDLLSQADELLETAGTPAQEDGQINDINEATSETFFDDIPQIDDFTTTSEPNDIPETNTTPTQDLLDDITENINNSNISDDNNDVSPISIDDLLNMSDDTPAYTNSAANDEISDNIPSDDKLGVLFNDTDPVTDAELDNMEEFNPVNNQYDDIEEPQIPGAAVFNKKAGGEKNNKKIVLIAAAVVTVIAAASAFVFLKPKNEGNENIAATESTPPAEILNTPQQPVPSDKPAEDVLANNVPDITQNKNTDAQAQKNKTAKELKNNVVNKKQPASESYLTVNRLVWDIPNSLAGSRKMQDYLRAAGKSIKLTLSADLLLASEYAYTNQVKVSLKLSKDGNVQEANIIGSSGSDEIDKIVLQSVKDTLNVVKPPSEDITTPDFNLNLIIYF